jgi:lipoate-protein ligase B
MQSINLGLISYELAYQKQKEILEKVIAGAEDTLLICHHPSVVTLGKKSNREQDLMGWSGDVVDIERGGKATYHGPGQIVIYPIVSLKNSQNIAGFLEAMERAMVSFLKEFGLNAKGNPYRGNPDLTGVWIDNRKIASIGIAVKRWVTYHGLAINIFEDQNAFTGINPCGMNAENMTYLLKEKMVDQTRLELENKLASYLSKELGQL